MILFNRSGLKFSVEAHPLALPGPFMTTFKLINKSKKTIPLQSVGWESKENGSYVIFLGESPTAEKPQELVTLLPGEKRRLEIPQSDIAKHIDQIKNFVVVTSDGKKYRTKVNSGDVWAYKIVPVACQMPKRTG